mgnify:CR=1 FL=1
MLPQARIPQCTQSRRRPPCGSAGWHCGCGRRQRRPARRHAATRDAATGHCAPGKTVPRTLLAVRQARFRQRAAQQCPAPFHATANTTGQCTQATGERTIYQGAVNQALTSYPSVRSRACDRAACLRIYCWSRDGGSSAELPPTTTVTPHNFARYSTIRDLTPRTGHQKPTQPCTPCVCRPALRVGATPLPLATCCLRRRNHYRTTMTWATCWSAGAM